MDSVIVTGVDGSQTALGAARQAAELGMALDAEVVVVCAFDKLEVQEVEADGRRLVFTTEESAVLLAEIAINRMREKFPDLRARAVAGKGKPADVLLDVAASCEATVIVVGNKRVQGAGRILGSIATDIAHRAPCDVYIANTHSRQA